MKKWVYYGNQALIIIVDVILWFSKMEMYVSTLKMMNTSGVLLLMEMKVITG